MGTYTILKNSQLDISLDLDYQDGGWSIVGGNAVHSGLNSGWIISTSSRAIIGEEYKLTLTVSDISPGGSVTVVFGGVSFVITENGLHTIDISAISSGGLSLYSESDVIVSPVVISEGEVSYRTLLYNPKGLFDSYISFTSDFMINLLGGFYTFKNGVLWKHNENEIRNSFYGVVEKSILRFAINTEPRIIKNLSHIKINGNKPWDLLEVFVTPYDGKPNGQRSRLKKNRFESLQGDLHASFLKDMSDPRFDNELQALFEGADLQGKIVEITMEVGGGEELRLVSIDFTYNNSNYTY